MSSFKESFVGAICKIGRGIVDHSPEILMVAGTVATAFGWNEARKAGVKGEELKRARDAEIELAKKLREKSDAGELPEGEEFTEKDYDYTVKAANKDYRVGMVKAYGPSVLLMIGGYACNWSGFLIEARRFYQMRASYFTKAQEMMLFEKAVSAAYGPEAVKQLKEGKDPTKPPIVNEDGTLEQPDLVDDNGKRIDTGGYWVFFDEATFETYSKDQEERRIFLSRAEQRLNDMLRDYDRKVITYNDILKYLGAKPHVLAQDGYQVGKIYIKDPILAKQLGVSNTIDLGCWDRSINGADYRFSGNADRAIILRINIDPIPILEYSRFAKTGKQVIEA